MKNIYLLKIIDENKNILVETMFKNLDDAKEQLHWHQVRMIMDRETIFKKSSVASITILTKNQIKRQLNKGRKIY